MSDNPQVKWKYRRYGRRFSRVDCVSMRCVVWTAEWQSQWELIPFDAGVHHRPLPEVFPRDDEPDSAAWYGTLACVSPSLLCLLSSAIASSSSSSSSTSLLSGNLVHVNTKLESLKLRSHRSLHSVSHCCQIRSSHGHRWHVPKI